jgi:hypothetical protein
VQDTLVAWIASSPADIQARLTALADEPMTTHLFVDDADQLGADARPLLEEAMRAARDRNLRVFVAGRSSEMLRSFESWIRYLVGQKCALLLCPGPDEGSVFDLRLPRKQATIPGRGFLVVRETWEPIQVAMPPGN